MKKIWLLSVVLMLSTLKVFGYDTVVVKNCCGGGTKKSKHSSSSVTRKEFNALTYQVALQKHEYDSLALVVELDHEDLHFVKEQIVTISRDVDYLFENVRSLDSLYFRMSDYLRDHPDVVKKSQRLDDDEYKKYLRSCRRRNTWATVIDGVAVLLTAGLAHNVMSIVGRVPEGQPQNYSMHDGRNWNQPRQNVYENQRRVAPVAVVGNQGGHGGYVGPAGNDGGHNLYVLPSGGYDGGHAPAGYVPTYQRPSPPPYSQPVQQYRQPSNYQPAQYRRY